MSHVNLGPPVAGAYIAPTLTTSVSGADVDELRFRLAPGQKAVLFAVTFGADTVVNTGGVSTLQVGTSGDANGYVTAQTLVDDTSAAAASLDGALVTSSTGRVEIAAGEEIIVTVTCLASSSATNVVCTLHMYVSSHGTNTPGRLSTADAFRDALNGQ